MEVVAWELLINGIESYLIFYLFSKILDYDEAKRRWPEFGAVLVFIGISAINFLHLDNLVLSRCLMLALMISYSCIAFGGKIHTRILWGAVPIIISMVADVVTGAIASQITSINLSGRLVPGEVRYFMTIIYIIICTIIYFSLSQVGKKERENLQFTLPYTIYIIALMVVGIFAIRYLIDIVVDFNIYVDEPHVSNQLIFVSVCFLVVYISVIILLRNYGRAAHNVMLRTLENQNYELKDQYYQSVTKSVEATKGLRHDFTNHLNVIRKLLDENKTEEARSYIADLDNSYREDLSIANYTSDEAVNAILNIKRKAAQDKNIKVQITSTFREKLPLPSSDACTILGNLFDNAIDAGVKNSDNAFIEIDIGKKKDMLVIRIRNGFSGKLLCIDGKFKTQKNDKGHGIGLSQVNKAVERANGMVHMEADENREIFTVMLFLPLN